VARKFSKNILGFNPIARCFWAKARNGGVYFTTPTYPKGMPLAKVGASKASNLVFCITSIINKQEGIMPYVRVWIHLVWSTKNREPMLRSNIRGKVFQHIRENAKERNIHIDCINGIADHVHALVLLSADRALSKMLQLIKGEASYWINEFSARSF
jgi:hypothetical protein